MRKEIKPGYHPRGRTTSLDNSNTAVHNCVVCRHPERDDIEREFLEGWRYCDIVAKHNGINKGDQVKEHFIGIGRYEDALDARQINVEEILEEIIRAGKSTLDLGKVYPRDIIEAAKALNDMKGKQKVKSLWDILSGKRNGDGSQDSETRSKEAFSG